MQAKGIAKRTAARVFCRLAVAACVLAAIGACVGTQAFAHADELDDARVELAAKATELASLTESLSQAQQDTQIAQEELDSIMDNILASQQQRAKLQQQLSSVSTLMYKDDSVGVLDILTSSQSLDELLARFAQMEAILTKAAHLASEEKRMQDQLASQYAQASERKDQSMAAEANLQQTKGALDAVLADLQERIDGLEQEAAAAAAAELAAAQEAARAAEQAAHAMEEAQQQQQAQREAAAAAADDAAAQVQQTTHADDEVRSQGGDAPAPVAEPAPQPEPEPAPAPEPEPEPEPEPVQTATPTSGDTSGWSTGVASAYGGSSDPSTPNPGITATGAVCDDWSMGVAVPMAWGPGPYYGRMVEISYNGMSVIATVNDCGGMGGGSRSLDLQPGVFKAFGFSTCQEWGIRTVSYRFL